MRRRSVAIPSALAALLVLGACAPQSQTRYDAVEVGRPLFVEFATVLAVREVRIQGKNSGIGGALGATAGGFALSPVGQGTGRAGAILGGALAGLALGVVAEQLVSNRTGVEYTLTLEDGRTVVIVQNLGSEDEILAPGDRAIIQQGRRFQRVLPANDLPEEIRRPRGVAVFE
ncbi:MAG: hypothetical protein AAF899_13525 [Pseudomonadota bacterium]